MAMKDRIARSKSAADGGVVTPFRRPSGRASFPHRVTLDLDGGQYEWLRSTAYDVRQPANTLIRAALSLLQSDVRLLERAVREAEKENPPPTA